MSLADWVNNESEDDNENENENQSEDEDEDEDDGRMLDEGNQSSLT